ncbi:MAG TPA: hypothetical protein VLA06_04040 [Woeseiaceae bacterium]|nr:hypothetical protein [Woeseiaceae bacterium]
MTSRSLGLAFAALLLAACGGGAETSTTPGPLPDASCNPANPATFGECGSVLIGFTDAEGDFLNYTVDLVSLTLETADGRVVEVLPRRARVNFTDYVDLTELVSVTHLPPATYVAGAIRLDYRNAEIIVESGDSSKEATVTDVSGVPLEETELAIHLADRDQLVVTKRRAHFLQLDFDLEASHDVDTTPTPATAAIDQFIVAEVHPVDEKALRVRGPLLDVNEAEMSYTIAVRPWHLRVGDFGRFAVRVSDDTEFEVNGDLYVGINGLRALEAAGEGTPTVARGTLNISDRSFFADMVLAGTSVPGIDRDAVVGNIIKREGNFLTVRGATIIPRDAATDRPAHFHDDVIVEVGPDTKVFRERHRLGNLTIEDLSIGQRVTIRGDLQTAATDASTPEILFDATAGAVRMHVTGIAGIVNTVMPGQADITLYSIDRRRVEVFDFSGTGPDAESDADPGNYEVRTFNLALADLAEGKPIVVRGFPTAFGSAPPDFAGRSVIDYTDVRSALGIGWGSAGTAEPFLYISDDGLVLDNSNPDIGVRHYIKQGPFLIDLTALDSGTTIVPRETGRLLFAIKTNDSLLQYADWSEFAAELTDRLGAGDLARSLHAYGKYDGDSNTFTAYKLGIVLLEP